LWARRYRKTIEDPHGEGDWPVPGPPQPRNILWSFTDARDAAVADRLAAAGHDRRRGSGLLARVVNSSDGEIIWLGSEFGGPDE
jgi:hypothetical protein